MLKNPESEWKPDDRRLESWVKLKPEYVRRFEVNRDVSPSAYAAHSCMPC